MGDGVSFAVFSAHAEKIEICLFSPDGRREIQRLPLPDRLGDIWNGFIPGLPKGTRFTMETQVHVVGQERPALVYEIVIIYM